MDANRFHNTKEAARQIGVGVAALSHAVWEGRVPEPMRAPNKAFLWTEHDMDKAAWVLRRRSLDDIRAERE